MTVTLGCIKVLLVGTMIIIIIVIRAISQSYVLVQVFIFILFSHHLLVFLCCVLFSWLLKSFVS